MLFSSLRTFSIENPNLLELYIEEEHCGGVSIVERVAKVQSQGQILLLVFPVLSVHFLYINKYLKKIKAAQNKV